MGRSFSWMSWSKYREINECSEVPINARSSLSIL